MKGKLLQALLLGLLAACDPLPETALKLVTIEAAGEGLSLRELPPQALKSAGLNFGLAVVRPGALAERVGLKVGDVVFGVNQKKVRSLSEFNQELRQGNGRIALLVRRGTTDFYVPVDLAAGSAPPQGRPQAPPRPAPGSKETLLRT